MDTYQIILPMPPSVNRMHSYGNRIGRKREPGVFRSKEYEEWIQWAGIAWRKQFPGGVPRLFTGRLRAQYMFVFSALKNERSDVFNREKCLSDYLQGKIFVDDNQIDEGQVFKRYSKQDRGFVHVWITEIGDMRAVDPVDVSDMGVMA